MMRGDRCKDVPQISRRTAKRFLFKDRGMTPHSTSVEYFVANSRLVGLFRTLREISQPSTLHVHGKFNVIFRRSQFPTCPRHRKDCIVSDWRTILKLTNPISLGFRLHCDDCSPECHYLRAQLGQPLRLAFGQIPTRWAPS